MRGIVLNIITYYTICTSVIALMLNSFVSIRILRILDVLPVQECIVFISLMSTSVVRVASYAIRINQM